MQSLKSLSPDESPLDFIRNNLRGPVAEDYKVIPEQVVSEANKRHDTAAPAAPVEPVKEELPKYDVAPPAPKVAPKVEEPKVEEPKVEEPKPTAEALVKDAAADMIEDPDVKELVNANNKEENFRTLRKKVKETENVLKEKEKTVEELSEKVKKFETGEELPEVLKEKEERIAQLEKYERLHALKTSPMYKQQFLEPFNQIKSKLAGYAKDYAIPQGVLERAFNISNKKDLNSFLSQHFDDVGALEVKQLVVQAQELNAKAIEAEKEPAIALAAMQQEYAQAEAAKKAHIAASIVESSKDGWRESLGAIRDEGKIKELIAKENDPEYNKTFVEPILNAAGTEYGKLVKELAANGLESLPKPLAYALARMVHLAHASAISIESREAAERKAEELRVNTQRTTRYLRPAIGGGQARGGEAVPAPKDAKEAADIILSKVLGTRR